MGKVFSIPGLLPARHKGRYFDNTVDAFNPQFWANESLAILEEQMIIGNLVHRDFEPIIQNYGDTINTRKVGEFEAKRKGTQDNVTIQDATAANIQVVLNHHVHVSFLIRDGEESKSITSLVEEYMAPAMIAEARYVDQALNMQVYRFLKNSYGRLRNLADSDVVERLTGIRDILNRAKAPMSMRNMLLTSKTETTFLRNSDFTDASVIGDNGSAMRDAHLGRLYGFENWTALNAPSVATGNTAVTGAINNGNITEGSTVLTVDGFAVALTTGSWLVVAGDDTPQRITAHSETLSVTTSITITPGLKHDVVDNAAVRVYTPGAVNFASGYAKGWPKGITVDGFSVAPKVGQMVSFGTASDIYGIIDVTGTTEIVLDRPLDAAITDDMVVGIGPPGDYNFVFTRNALAMVVRPLAMPRAGMGALSQVVNLNGLSMRATLTYDGNKQGTLVTLDMLMGFQVLDENLGGVLLG